MRTHSESFRDLVAELLLAHPTLGCCLLDLEAMLVCPCSEDDFAVRMS